MVIAAFNIIFWQIFCGWLCHFGAVQELAWWIFEKCGINLKLLILD